MFGGVLKAAVDGGVQHNSTRVHTRAHWSRVIVVVVTGGGAK